MPTATTESSTGVQVSDAQVQRFMTGVFAWMFAGLMVSGITAFFVSTSETLVKLIFSSELVFFGIVIFELILVFGLMWLLKSKSVGAGLATALFLFYAFVSGVTLSAIFLIYEISSIFLVFCITAVVFGAMALYGYFTKKDLTSIGSFLLMALLGVIIGSVINIFLNNSMLDLILTCVGVVIFTVLTAYDVQKIKKAYAPGSEGTDEGRKGAIMGALMLYLDFVNLFLELIKLLGKRRD